MREGVAAADVAAMEEAQAAVRGAAEEVADSLMLEELDEALVETPPPSTPSAGGNGEVAIPEGPPVEDMEGAPAAGTKDAPATGTRDVPAAGTEDASAAGTSDVSAVGTEEASTAGGSAAAVGAGNDPAPEHVAPEA